MMDWSQIVHEHGPMVWRTIDRLLAHEADTADCFQRTFIAALELSQRETIRHWPAVLKRLANHRALERLRQRIRENRRSASLLEGRDIQEQADRKFIQPDGAAQFSELTEQLRIALTEIDEQHAQVFCLACLEESSYREIAEQLGIKTNHVGVLLSRAKASLRERLKEFEPIMPATPNVSELEA
jgi:RNA polymerase sigma-70 factor (ECF subfamily)